MLKSYGVVEWVVAYEILVSAQGPLVLGFGVLGLRVWGQGLTKTSNDLMLMGLMCIHSFTASSTYSKEDKCIYIYVHLMKRC